ncbi:MAG: sugar kinase [Pseudorhodoplanes sp.]|nr:sugar kinase [Pseudorhodoplanes sp.]
MRQPSTMKRFPSILCAGITVLDNVFQVERFPEPGTKTRASDFTAVTGGCAANAAIAAARLEGRVYLVTPLGDATDPIASDIVRHLEAERVDCSGILRVPGAISPISAIFVDASGERLIVNHRDQRLAEARIANADALLEGIDAVMVDNRFAHFVLPLAQAARARGTPVLLDGDEPTPGSDALLAAVSHCVFSADGLRATAGCSDLAEALSRVQARTGAQLAVTDGPNGLLWRDGGIVRHIRAYPVAAVDTLAAGDVFHGACVVALGEGHDFEHALGFAAAAAALKCRHFGGITGAPTRAETDAFLRERAAEIRP